MSIRQVITNYFQDRRRYRLLIGGGLAVLVVLIVLFNQDLGNLLRWLQGRAAQDHWTTTSDLVTKTMHSKSIVVEQNGTRYLYVVGGAEQYLDPQSGEKRLKLLNTVQRVEVDATGKIVELAPGVPALWEGGATSTDLWTKMYAGHAEFGLVEYKQGNIHWLLVVSGDIHVPYADVRVEQRLLFSTIEKLDLNATTPEWTPIALVSGVNFYPEVLISNGRLEIVGGVYGNPFAKYYNEHPWYADGGYWNVKDPLYPEDDKAKWNDTSAKGYKNIYNDGGNQRRVFGNVGITLKNGSYGDNILAGGTVKMDAPISPGFPIGFGMNQILMGDDQVHIQDLGDNQLNLSALLSRELMNGNFATTVSEHYEIVLDNGVFGTTFYSELGTKTSTNPVGDPNDIEAGGNDYAGTISDVWPDSTGLSSGVVHIGHLRIIVDTFFYLGDEPHIYPAPQGRYGHKLVEAGKLNNTRLYVLGGASWSAPVTRYHFYGYDNDGVPVSTTIETYNFWVIEDAYDPITINTIFSDNTYDYQFVGNQSYEWNSTNQIWKGTNPDFNTDDGFHRFDESNFKPLSGAFFGLAKLTPKSNAIEGPEFLAVGGLANNPGVGDYPEQSPEVVTWPALKHSGGSPGMGNHKWGISVKVMAEAKHYANFEWVVDSPTGASPSYGSSAVGIGGYAVTFGGQSTFQTDPDAPFDNDLVPDISDSITTQTNRFNLLAGGLTSWTPISNFDVNTAFYAVGNVITDPGNMLAKTIYIYKSGGGTPGNPTNLSKKVEYLGPFTFGTPGVVDPNQSTIEIISLRGPSTNTAVDVNQDGVDESVPTVWNDHYDYATATITLKDYYGTAVTGGGLAASLYTSRSSLPAINKYGPKPDDIRILDAVNAKPKNTGDEWEEQLIEVDADGKAKFRLWSAVATDEDPIQPSFMTVYGYWGNVDGNYSSGQQQIGSAPMIFTVKGHPYPEFSDLIADPSVVKADNTDVSNLKGIVKDYQKKPLDGFTVSITSNRNRKVDPDPDNFGPDNTSGSLGIVDLIPDTDGFVFANVRSNQRGSSIMRGYYTIPGHDDGLNPSDIPKQAGFKSVMVWFTLDGRIVSLVPSSGKQSQSILDLSATGEDTIWTDDDPTPAYNTTVDFVAPSSRFSLADGTDINKKHLVADGLSITNFVVSANSAGEAVTLKISEGGGYLLPQHAAEETVYASGSLQAAFQYEASDTAGILKIEAKFADNSTDVLWLPLVDANGYADLTTVPVPEILTSAGSLSVITATPANYYGSGIPVSEVVWDKPVIKNNAGTISDGSADPTGYSMIFNYTSDSSNGVASIFITGTYHTGQSDETKLVTMVPIMKNYASGADTDIIFNSPATLDITSPIALNMLNGITIGSSAPTGVWNFVVSTIVNQGGEDVAYVETAPFQVYDRGASSGPFIDTIDPNRGLRGNQNLQVTITGLGTHFQSTNPDKSVVTFIPVNSYSGSDPNGVTATIISGTPTELVVSLNISDHATMGYWNVKVTTGTTNQEIAEMVGDHDFLVTTLNGYFVDLFANPTSIPRDGSSTSKVTAKVGFLNESTGLVTNQTSKSVNFAFSPLGSDAGSLNPLTGTTNNDGEAESTYTTDQGTANDEVTVSASVVIDATTTVIGTVIIQKEGVDATTPSRAESTMSAWSPVPVDTDGNGDPYSTVTVTVRNSVGSPLSAKQVTLVSNRTADVIASPAQKNTDADGKAVFRVSSSTVGISLLTANITEGDIDLTANVKFVADDGTLVLRNWKITVPFQARDYENRDWVKLVIKDTTHTGIDGTYYNETYRKNPRTGTNPNLLADFSLIPTWMYADSGTKYTLWVKGKNHLAKDKTDITSGSTTDVIVDFGPLTSNRGLLAGDIVKGASATAIAGGFHDNIIGKLGVLPTEDLGYAVTNWFSSLDLADINFDTVVNSVDVLYILTNLGSGTSMPTP